MNVRPQSIVFAADLGEIIAMREIVICRIVFVFVRCSVGVMVMMVVGVIIVDLVNEAEAFQQRVRSHGRPCGQQQHCNKAANEPHARRVNEVAARATVEMG